ncbi:MAG TPA: hypothetical protein VI408_01410 [Gaiellaceae bacterium]
MRLAFWPGGGGGPDSFEPIAPALAAAGVDVTTLDPRYDERTDWSIPSLAGELAATGADAYGGFSWGGAVAVTAALLVRPRAVVLVDGGHFGGSDFPPEPLDEAGTEEARSTMAAIFEGYARYDAAAALPKLDRETRVLLVAAGRNPLSTEHVPRFERLVPWADVRIVESGHDIPAEAPGELGDIVAEWLQA